MTIEDTLSKELENCDEVALSIYEKGKIVPPQRKQTFVLDSDEHNPYRTRPVETWMLWAEIPDCTKQGYAIALDDSDGSIWYDLLYEHVAISSCKSLSDCLKGVQLM